MSDLSIPGISSKYNTNKIIEDLMKVERVPLDRMEETVSEYEEQKKVWQDLNRRVSGLQRASKKLYSFENPFSEKVVTSSDEKVLTAVSTREADFDEYSFDVVQIARGDKFLSDPVSSDYKVPEGNYTFQVGEEEITLKYRGGRLSDFVNKVNEKGDRIVKLSLIKNTADTQLLVMESKKTGAENRLIFTGETAKLALDLGLIRSAPVQGGQVEMASGSLVPWTKGVDSSKTAIQDGSLILKPGAEAALPLSAPYDIQNGTVLEYEIKTEQLSSDYYLKQPPPELVLPNVPDVTFQDITIESSGSSVELPEWDAPVPPARISDMKVLYVSDGSLDVPLPDIQDSSGFVKVQVPLAGRLNTLESVKFRNNNTYRTVTVRNINVTEPGRQGEYEPVNPVTTAGNAKILFEGIEIERETNSIDDLIPGLTLNLHSPGKEPIDLKVEPDVELVKKNLIEFVYNYNQVITLINVLSSDDQNVVNELEYLSDDEREDALDKLGMFKGDLTLIQLKSQLQTLTVNSYETFMGDELSLLAQLGISTNATGTRGEGINYTKLRGYLEVDEKKLEEWLKNNMPAVKELFGSDTDGDYIVDSGVAKRLDEYLIPYTQTGGFISTKIGRIDSQIDRTEKDMEDYKKHLVDYEAELKRKYGQMEGMLNQMEKTSDSLDNTWNNNNRK